MPLAVVERQRVAAKPRSRAIASDVAESIPPESEHDGRRSGQRALDQRPGVVAPEHLVQLHLEAHRQAVGEDPVGELAGRELLVARREQHVAAGVQALVLAQPRAAHS